MGISDNKTPTLLNAVVAIGIVVGAAAKLVTLKSVVRCVPAGVLVGVAVAILARQTQLSYSLLMLVTIGVSGGFFIVPLNALLQHLGKKYVGVGNAIAVQNLGENAGMLVILALYSAVVGAGVPVKIVGTGFGVLFALAITVLWQRFQARQTS